MTAIPASPASANIESPRTAAAPSAPALMPIALTPGTGDWDEVSPAPYYSMVVPMYNEGDSIQELYEGLTRNLAAFGKDYEIIFINDGSKDDTLDRLTALAARDPHVFVINLRRNFGQTPA